MYKLIGAKRLKTQQEDTNDFHRIKERKTAIDLTSDDETDQFDDQFGLDKAPEITIQDKDQRLLVPQASSSYNIKITEAHSLKNFESYEQPHESNLLVETPSKSISLNADILNGSTSGSSITMLSSTSLLHGNCIFNRNNTVATQAGLKTYWLCKSYRVSMCKARCITHQVCLNCLHINLNFIV